MNMCLLHLNRFFVRLLMSFIFFTPISSVFAQTLTLGPSLNLGAAMASNPTSNARKLGFTGAIGSQAFLDFNDEFGLFFGLLAEARSFKQTLTLTDVTGVVVGNVDVQKKTMFVDLPIGFRIKIGAQHRWYVSGGCSINQMVFEQNKVKNQMFFSFVPIAPLSPSKQSFEFAVIGGIGYSFPIGAHSHVNIEWRNNFGLSDRSSVIASSASRERTHTLQLIFCFGKK